MGNKRIKIAYLCHRRYLETKMSRGPRFHYPRAVAAHNDIDLMFTGPGQVGYHDDWSVERNMKALGFRPDVLWFYKPDDLIGVDYGIPKVVSYNEAWWPQDRAYMEVSAFQVDLVICHHQNDVDRFHPEINRAKIVHIPHAADPKLFASNLGLSQRSNRAMLFGVLSDEHYPLRAQMAEAIKSGLIPAAIRKHPGYKLPNAEACESQFRHYASDVRSTAVFLTCASKWHYLLEKIVQAAMAGCIIVTDEPDDDTFRNHIAPYCVIVPHDAKADQTAAILRSKCPFLWEADSLTPISAWASIAFNLQSVALREFSTTAYANRFVEAVKSIL